MNSMQGQVRGRGTRALWLQFLLASAYWFPLSYLGTLTGGDTWDGVLGVVLGLYICSHPAAAAIDVLFADRFAFRAITSARSGVYWLLLNVAVLLAGWLVIFVGMTRFVRDFPR